MKTGSMLPPVLFFFLKIALAIWDLLWFHTHFRIVYSIFVKNVIGILIGIALDLYITLGNMDIIFNVNSSIHEYWIFSYSFVFSSRLSSMSYTGHSPPWLNLFLETFFWWNCKAYCFLSCGHKICLIWFWSS